MASSRVRALSYLGYRALVANPRLRREGSGLERFLAHHAGEGLAPTRPERRVIGEAASAAFRLHGRSAAELPLAAGAA